MAQGDTYTIEATVERVNDSGVILAGETEWFNYSVRNFKGAKPKAGDDVEVTINEWSDRKWIQACKVLTSAAPARPPATRRPANQPQSEPERPSTNGHVTGKDRLYARMSALKSATAMAAGKDVKAEHVLAAAEKFLGWLMSPDEEEIPF